MILNGGHIVGRQGRMDYLRANHPCHRTASRTEKERILDEFCRVTGYHRKYAVRFLDGAATSELRAMPILRRGRVTFLRFGDGWSGRDHRVLGSKGSIGEIAPRPDADPTGNQEIRRRVDGGRPRTRGPNWNATSRPPCR